MKIVILITVIESSAVMLAILYFYYRRSQSGKRALVRRGDVSITKQTKLALPREVTVGIVKIGARFLLQTV